MFAKQTRQSIRYRFLVMVAGILLISALITSAIIARNERDMLSSSLATKGRSFAAYIAKLSQDPLIMKNSIQLDSIVHEANKDEDILFAVIRDEQGTLITSQYASINYRLPKLQIILSGLPKQSELKDVLAAIRKNEPVLELSVPVASGAEVIGTVTVGMSEQKVRDQIVRIIFVILALNVSIALSLGAVIFVASKKIILDPISELARAADSLAKGGLSTRVTIRGKGEIQMLVDSFNRMAEELDETTVSKEELERTVLEKTEQLLAAQQELVHREKLAILGQITANIGNELRNPLGVMNNAVYFLQTVLADENDTIKEYLGIIKSEIAGAERIVSDLLDAVRTKPPHPQLVLAEELIRMSLKKCRIPERVRVEVMSATQLSVLIDPLQMKQAFINLVSNGVDAMPEGGLLKITAEEDKPAKLVKFTFTDAGAGIAPENMAKLFQPLFTTKARGIGLGLVVVKNLTDANGGKVSVESEIGKGTTFTIDLPVGDGRDTRATGV